ncbi:hypothetical protein ACNJ7E_43590 [Rhodococcus sp. NM-2]|uniref:hypothetical protein n=1 Tax=Rhodococcus sp. NM-2 TaxID=3401174 RepID=UPI003AAB1CD2
MSAAWHAEHGASDAAPALSAHPLVEPPPPECQADIWPEPVYVPDDRRTPSWWLVGACGGAGVSMLTASWSIAGDTQRAFPGGLEEESPFVLVVAREHAAGIGQAHDLLTQHLSGYGGPTTLLGLVTVAAKPGKLAAPLRQRLEVVAGLVDDRHWRIPWIEQWISLTPSELPSWSPGDPIGTGRKREPPETTVPREVAAAGESIRATILQFLQTPTEERQP